MWHYYPLVFLISPSKSFIRTISRTQQIFPFGRTVNDNFQIKIQIQISNTKISLYFWYSIWKYNDNNILLIHISDFITYDIIWNIFHMQKVDIFLSTSSGFVMNKTNYFYHNATCNQMQSLICHHFTTSYILLKL